MPEMVNPHDALLSFQQALQDGSIEPTACALYPNLVLLHDTPAKGVSRLTYALLDNEVVKALVIYIPAQPLNGVHCFSVGYAVAEPFRNKGVATTALEMSIAEMRHGFQRHMPKFYIEAVVGVSNAPSQKVAARVLSPEFKEGVDKESGQPALIYVRLIES